MLRLCYYAWEIAEVAKANRVDWFIGKEMFTANLTNGRNDNKGADTPYAILSPEWNALGLAEQVKQEAEFMDMVGTAEGGKFKELSAALGKETIDTFNTGESRGRELSHSLNYQKLGKELASVDELAVLDGGKCILQLRGVRPFLSNKYDITKHPNYIYLADYNEKNTFDIERFLSTRLKLKANEVCDVYEIDAADEE